MERTSGPVETPRRIWRPVALPLLCPEPIQLPENEPSALNETAPEPTILFSPGTDMARQKVLAIIPARGGSKGIPRKNLVDICGKPLIAYTIEAALKSETIDHVFVSHRKTWQKNKLIPD